MLRALGVSLLRTQNHAARQRRYRSKQTEKVTQDGSIETEGPAGHSAKQNLPISWDLVSAQSIICHFCFGICSSVKEELRRFGAWEKTNKTISNQALNLIPQTSDSLSR